MEYTIQKLAGMSGISTRTLRYYDQIGLLDKGWLSYTWKNYSRDAHIGVAQMYTADERFTKYYDEKMPGCAAFLKAAVENHA